MIRHSHSHLPRLTNLVGAGPDISACGVQLRVINRDEELQLLQLKLSVITIDQRTIAQLHWCSLLPRKSARDIQANLDWFNGTLSVEGEATSTFKASIMPKTVHMLRAELLGNDGKAYDVLEIGVRSADDVFESALIGVSL